MNTSSVVRNRSADPCRYRGRIRAIVLDWAGTTVDFGSCAPVAAFCDVFGEAGVLVTPEEARIPMGRGKLDHIRELLAMPAVAERWRTANGKAATDADAKWLYDRFLPVQLKSLAAHATLIPGTLEMVRFCQERGIKIGSSTGYSRQLMEQLTPLAAKQGYQPEAIVCVDDVPEGRPAPWMQLENAKRLNVFPMEAVVTVDDTVVGIQAGLNAGTWTVGVVKTGNEMGLSQEELEALPQTEVERRLTAARQKLMRSGAHYLIDSVAQLAEVVNDIEARMESGERP